METTAALNSNGSITISVSEEEEKPSEESCTEPLNGDVMKDTMATHTVTCHSVTYQVDIPKCAQCRRNREQKTILNNIDAVFAKGMNAILGPTGSGKSSLLDILAGRKDPRHLSGQVLLNGMRRPPNYKNMTGYVMQDDMLSGMLTVRENIQFTATLGMPRGTTQKQRDQRVQEVIEELGLVQCADTKVGTAFMRGISGGERKRVCIAMELVMSPQLLFLDEPTTGLDAFTAQTVMLVLQRLARRGMTVIFSIHQPRYSIFKLFDHMVLLNQGEVIYQGAAHEALEYFHSLDYICEDHNNPADFFLDVVQGACIPVSNEGQTKVAAEYKNDSGSSTDQVLLSLEQIEDAEEVRQRHLTEQFKKSKWNQRLQEQLQPFQRDKDTDVNQVSIPQKMEHTSAFLTQLHVVSSRTFRNMVQNPHTLMTQVASAILLALVVGTIYFQLDMSFKSGIQNRVGAFFFIVMNHVFGNMAAVDTFIRERPLFIHENLSGYYRVSTYFLAKWFCDVLPMKLAPVVVFSVITYWMVGLRASCTAYLFYLLNTLLTSLSGTGVALILSASVQVHTIGTILTALIWVFMMVFSGLLVNLDSISPWLQWIKYLSIFRYSMNGFIINEMKGMQFCSEEEVELLVTPPGNTSYSIERTPKCDTGNDYMLRQGIAHTTSWDLWQNEAALFFLMVFFLTITYIQLRRIQKYR